MSVVQLDVCLSSFLPYSLNFFSTILRVHADKVLSWMEQYDLPQLLHQSGGLVKISNFLPVRRRRGEGGGGKGERDLCLLLLLVVEVMMLLEIA